MSHPSALAQSAKVGVIATLLIAGLATYMLSQVGWEPSLFGAFGEDSHATTEYAQDRLGGDIWIRSFNGHDGKFFFVQANDPWVLNPETNASVLDRPLYRSQRMLYPVLAGGFGVFGPEQIIWAMLVVNVISMGLGSWAVAALAVSMGGSKWWGLSFALNLGFISEMNIDGAGIVAAGAAFAAIYLLQGGRLAGAISFLSVSVLAREAMLIVAAGAAVWLWRDRRQREALLTAGIPGSVVVLWAVYLRMRIGWESGVAEVQEIGLPFAGFIEAIPTWLTEPYDLLVAVFILVLLGVFTRRALSQPSLIGYAFVGFSLLGVLFTVQVWRNYFDITRAVAPAITAFILITFARTKPVEASPVETKV